MPFILDSDVLIDYTRQRKHAAEYIEALPNRSISQITAMELIVGARDKREVAYLDELFTEFVIVPLSASIGGRGYDLLKTYSKSHGLHVFDSLIAAMAIEEGLTLVSKNQRHFQMVAGLDLQVPDY